MSFEESQRWYTMVAEVFVVFAAVLDKGVDAAIKKLKLYRIYRSDARLEVLTPASGYAET
jgi:hypothetical protein